MNTRPALLLTALSPQTLRFEYKTAELCDPKPIEDAELAAAATMAYLDLMIGVDEVEVLQLETMLNYRRQGLAKALLSQSIAWCQKNQRRAIWLEVRLSNAPALALYQKVGFIVARQREAYYANGENALVMKYQL